MGYQALPEKLRYNSLLYFGILTCIRFMECISSENAQNRRFRSSFVHKYLQLCRDLHSCIDCRVYITYRWLYLHLELRQAGGGK